MQLSAEEAERHSLTHVPYRDWCEVCVRAKARDNPHRKGRQQHDMDEVQCDYLFLGSQQHKDPPTITILTIIWVDEGAISATMAVKGVNPFMGSAT